MKSRLNKELFFMHHLLWSLIIISSASAQDRNTGYVALPAGKVADGGVGTRPVPPHVPPPSTDRNAGSIALPAGKIADGGVCTLSSVPPHTATVEITTRKGERMADIAKRLAKAANQDASFSERNRYKVTSRGEIISGLRVGWGGSHVFGGTDRGLGIPSAPTSLSLSYDFEDDKLFISWDNGGAKYSSVACPLQGWPSWTMPGDATQRNQHTVSKWPITYPLDNFTAAVVGYVGRTPSNASVMRLKGSRQEEVYELPFSNGISPNWRSWEVPSMNASTGYKEGVHATTGALRTRYQTVTTEGKSAESRYDLGLYRKFFDLKPGVRYRFGMRTKLSGGGKDVSFSIVACPQKQRDVAFKPAMTASTAGSDKSSQTRELFSCNLRKDGGHDWTERETGRDDGCADILMPAACETLLVWVRLHGAGEGKAEACFDGVFLEQLPSDDTRQ